MSFNVSVIRKDFPFFNENSNLVYFDNGKFCHTTEQWNSPYILENDIPPWDKIDLPKIFNEKYYPVLNDCNIMYML